MLKKFTNYKIDVDEDDVESTNIIYNYLDSQNIFWINTRGKASSWYPPYTKYKLIFDYSEKDKSWNMLCGLFKHDYMEHIELNSIKISRYLKIKRVIN
jgi:hypothetical protein